MRRSELATVQKLTRSVGNGAVEVSTRLVLPDGQYRLSVVVQLRLLGTPARSDQKSLKGSRWRLSPDVSIRRNYATN